ncbi:hypothetical protein ONS96_013380 [Cadophora gregata f. sp. sojae]|nr:hypothetical protein ONS96_013380 [Cadophora gregata f. sp. sojae]
MSRTEYGLINEIVTPTGGAPIILASPAPNGNVANMGWCCGFPLDNGTCPQGGTIKIAIGTVYATAGVTSSTSSVASSSATSSAAASTSSSSAAIGVSGNATQEEGRCEENHEVAIGAGVGIPLGIAALVCLGMWLRERRMRRGERLRAMAGYDGLNRQGIGIVPGSYGVVSENGNGNGNGTGMMGVRERDRKNPMEIGDGRRPEELP